MTADPDKSIARFIGRGKFHKNSREHHGARINESPQTCIPKWLESQSSHTKIYKPNKNHQDEINRTKLGRDSRVTRVSHWIISTLHFLCMMLHWQLNIFGLWLFSITIIAFPWRSQNVEWPRGNSEVSFTVSVTGKSVSWESSKIDESLILALHYDS